MTKKSIFRDHFSWKVRIFASIFHHKVHNYGTTDSKFGWQAETREQLLNRFVSSRPASPAISEDEIMDEIRAIRYAK